MKKVAVAFLCVCVFMLLESPAACSDSAEEKYILENRVIYRVKADGQRRKIDSFNVRASADGTILWFSVYDDMQEATCGSESGVYFFDDKEQPLFYLPWVGAGVVADIYFSPDNKQMVLDGGTWVIREFILYDFNKTEVKAEFRGLDSLIWLDSHRFAFTLPEPNEPRRPTPYDPDDWRSVVVYDTATKTIIPVIKAIETRDYTLVDADLSKGTLQIIERSVKNIEDWAESEYQEKEITLKAP